MPAPEEYDYTPAPAITSVSPQFASEDGTSADVISGSGFNLLTFESVCSVTGCSAPNPKVDTFQLANAGRPVVNSSSPASGPAHGGTVWKSRARSTPRLRRSTSDPHPRRSCKRRRTHRAARSSSWHPAPVGVVAKAGVKSATVSWKAPTDTGGSPLTGYEIIASAKGHKPVVVKVSRTVTKAVVGKLAAGVSWRFTVQASNKPGLGLAATSNAVTPSS